MAMTALVPIIRAEGEGDKRSFFGGGIHTWKLMTEETDGAFFLFEDTMTQGKTPSTFTRRPTRPSTPWRVRSSCTSTEPRAEYAPVA